MLSTASGIVWIRELLRREQGQGCRARDREDWVSSCSTCPCASFSRAQPAVCRRQNTTCIGFGSCFGGSRDRDAENAATSGKPGLGARAERNAEIQRVKRVNVVVVIIIIVVVIAVVIIIVVIVVLIVVIIIDGDNLPQRCHESVMVCTCCLQRLCAFPAQSTRLSRGLGKTQWGNALSR